MNSFNFFFYETYGFNYLDWFGNSGFDEDVWEYRDC